MSEWKEKEIGQICKVKGGKRLPAGKEFAEGITPFPYLRVKDMVNGTIDSSELEYVTPEIEPAIRTYKISKEDLYVTIAGTLGMFGSIPDYLDNAQLTENAAKLCEIDLSEFDKDFLKYYLNSELIKTQVNKEIGVGGGVPKLALFRIEKLIVKYPHQTIQGIIAHILRKADNIIDKTQFSIDKYKAIKRGMLHDLFTRGIDNKTGKLRPKFDDAPEFYKESKLGMIPKEWEVQEFFQSCELITDGSHFSPKPLEFGEIIVNVKDMGEFGIKYDNCTRISTKDFIELKKQNCSPQYNDVLLSKDGTIGRIILFKDDRDIVILSSIAILRTSNKLSPEYFYTFMKSEYFEEQLIVKISGSALKRIVLRDINSLLIANPIDIEEQKFISDRIIQIENKIHSEQNYLHKLQQIKSGLMGDLLSGKKKVKVGSKM